ncbi:DUF167 domain-containing protein [Patescibacteria group bacterium]|nr:DUF167 domain-containing protein [Patescibacteria group bacterium]
MQLTVHVKPNAPVNRVIPVDDATYRVFTTATPERGKANQAVIKLLADFFDVAPSRICIKFGRSSKEKIVVISE